MLPWLGEMTFLGQDAMVDIQNSIVDLDHVFGKALSRVFLPSTEAEHDEVIKALGEEIKLTGRLLEIAFKTQDPQTSEDQQ